MEHILQFAIGIDDAGIKKRVEEVAKVKIVKELKDDIKFSIITKWGNLTSLSESIIRQVMDENKDEIIDKASVMIADSIRRSKKYREALSKIVEEVEE